jgi:hypothetical protein
VTWGAGLGSFDPRALTETRIGLHHAALLASAVGRTFAGKQPGFRQAALHWNAADRSLDGATIMAQDERAVHARLQFDTCRLGLMLGSSLDLAGRTFADVEDAMRRWLTAVGLDGVRLTARVPSDLPPGPIQHGDEFAIDLHAAAELGRWFAFADERLAEVSSAHDVPLPVPLWPDHFDLSVPVPLPAPAPDGAQIGVGFSPGDGAINEPYCYVTPRPIPAARVAEVPAPAGGHWQVDGWVGLVLPATTILAADDPSATVTAFLTLGFEIGRDLVVAG